MNVNEAIAYIHSNFWKGSIPGLSRTQELLRRFPDVDGIVACNDMVAISAYKLLHKLGISVPDQVQIVGFDGIHLSGLLSPELTTVVQPIEEIGRLIKAKNPSVLFHVDAVQGFGKARIFPKKWGVDFLAVGALTHSSGVLDLGLDF